MLKRHLLAAIAATLCLTSCHQNSRVLEPNVFYVPQDRHIRSLPNTFPKLNLEELRSEWGKELKIGMSFTYEMDLYRAITSFKRALILMPQNLTERRWQAEYGLVLCYYLGNHFKDAAETFESSTLSNVPDSFPAFRNLMLILFDSYNRIEDPVRACAIYNLLEKYDPEAARDLNLGKSITEGNLPCVREQAENRADRDEILQFTNCYCLKAKSVQKAQALNAILPGAGYYYVGLKKSAFTSLTLNALFTLATIHFFEHGNIAAGLITLSFETGWYFGGINGAGLAAKEYNQFVYNTNAKETMMKQNLFPVLMFQHSF